MPSPGILRCSLCLPNVSPVNNRLEKIRFHQKFPLKSTNEKFLCSLQPCICILSDSHILLTSWAEYCTHAGHQLACMLSVMLGIVTSPKVVWSGRCYYETPKPRGILRAVRFQWNELIRHTIPMMGKFEMQFRIGSIFMRVFGSAIRKKHPLAVFQKSLVWSHMYYWNCGKYICFTHYCFFLCKLYAHFKSYTVSQQPMRVHWE